MDVESSEPSMAAGGTTGSTIAPQSLAVASGNQLGAHHHGKCTVILILFHRVFPSRTPLLSLSQPRRLLRQLIGLA